MPGQVVGTNLVWTNLVWTNLVVSLCTEVD